ncbi:MAG: T9SS type A sorting domain-containing protein [Flavobacteriales bacterium]|nr:T9SS type A sorting domain-containing protein [Flavobacteriales bacterium]
MKKILLLNLLMFAAILTSKSQTVIIADSFDTYNSGDFIAQVGTPNWTTWSNTPGGAEDAKITNTQSSSPSNSLFLDNANDDIILKLGNKTSGAFSIEFKYFIPTGFGGYFNIQHYQNPGIQWANEVYFGNNGAGQLKANGATINFSHANNAWVDLKTIVDIDNDTTAFYVNGTHIHTWPFATQASGGAGQAQLGSVNFYCGSISGQTPKYYVDDVTFTELVQPLAPPTINVNVTDIYTNGLAPETFNITNNGDQDLTYYAYPTYPFDANNVSIAPVISQLTYDQGSTASGVGYASDVTVKAASKFIPTKLADAIGQSINSVDVTIWDTASNYSLLVYDRGSFITPGPGTLLYTIPFTVSTTFETVNVVIPTPIYVDGKDLWIGYVCDALANTYPLGVDGGPRIADVNWVSTGPGWTGYDVSIDANLQIYGNLQGNPIEKWLTVSPSTGTVTPSQSQQITLTFDTTGLVPGNYLSVVEIGSNDPTNEYTQVNVHLTVSTSIDKVNEKISVMTYPNPTTSNINVKSDNTIDFVSIYGLNGQIVKTIQVNSTSAVVEVNQLAKGTYVMEIKTGNNITKRNVVIQ